VSFRASHRGHSPRLLRHRGHLVRGDSGGAERRAGRVCRAVVSKVERNRFHPVLQRCISIRSGDTDGLTVPRSISAFVQRCIRVRSDPPFGMKLSAVGSLRGFSHPLRIMLARHEGFMAYRGGAGICCAHRRTPRTPEPGYCRAGFRLAATSNIGAARRRHHPVMCVHLRARCVTPRL
jgi:hypothetical protein